MSGILVATHGGASADGAVRVAARLAERLHVELRALAVVVPDDLVDYAYGTVALDPMPEEELRRCVQDQLRRAGAEDTLLEIVSGNPATVIAAAARRSRAELIVTGIGPHNLVERALGRETMLQLVETATVPILAVPTRVAAIPHKVVAALDFTPTSVHAARTVARWLAPGDALDLVHVEARPAPSAPIIPEDSTRQTPAGRLGECGADLASSGKARLHTGTIVGDPAKAVLDYATEVGADLIALGSHGYGAWKRLAVGSVASRVVRHASISVLVAPIGCIHHGQVAAPPPRKLVS